MHGRRLIAGVIAAFAVLATNAAPVAANTDPPLSEATAKLANAFECSRGLASAARTPVLLVHGTGSNPEESWSWGYRKVLPELGIPTCTVTLPDRALDDIQRSVEYVVYAVRRMHVSSDRRISIIGHSQGGLHPVWALRFWPSLKPMVDDSIGMAAPYQGTRAGLLLDCETTGCPPAAWQQTTGSNFIAALNRERPPTGPSYTSISSEFDTVVYPQPEASRLAGASQILVQEVCPNRPVEHFAHAGDAATFGIVIDALEHPGPAVADRVPQSYCNQITLPGADLVKMALIVPVSVTFPGLMGLAYENQVRREPPLRCYARPACRRRARKPCGGVPLSRLGTPSADRFRGTRAADGFRLFGGSDRAVGRRGADGICGDGEADRLRGGRGADALIGGKAADKLIGGSGRDMLFGGPGRDVLVGGPGRDECRGGRGRDVLRRC